MVNIICIFCHSVLFCLKKKKKEARIFYIFPWSHEYHKSSSVKPNLRRPTQLTLRSCHDPNPFQPMGTFPSLNFYNQVTNAISAPNCVVEEYFQT